jgi:hypothetical protein
VATGGCSNITYIAPNFPGNLISFFTGEIKNCQASACGGIPLQLLPVQARSWLEKKNSDGSWTTIQGPVLGSNLNFTGLAPGIYRVHTQIPIKTKNKDCPEGITVFNCLGQNIGMLGGYDNGTTIPGGPGIPPIFIPGAGHSWSNSVFVGPTQQSDISWNFIDGNEAGETDDVFDFGEQVRINTTGTQNHTHWWLAIFENQAPTRYKSNGWTSGQIPNIIDLTAFWTDNGQNGWGDFLSLHSYTVQLAITNQCNTVWTNLDKTFFVCPSGSGCRLADMMPELKISPNPTSDVFKINGITLYEKSKVVTNIYDMSGKLVKSQKMNLSDEVQVDDIQNGFYIVRVLDNNTQLLASKLVKVN